MPRRIKSAKIQFISLVPRGANNMPTIYKSDDGNMVLNTLTKAMDDFDEKGELLSLVYVPDKVDLHGDFADADTIEKMAHSFGQAGMNLDIRHDGEKLPREKAYVAETFIVQKGDERFTDFKDGDGEVVDATGSWAVLIKIEDEDLRKAYRDGKWAGVSMAGPAVVEAAKEDDATNVFMRLLKRLLNSDTDDSNGELDMKADELKQVLKDNNKELAETIVTGLAKAMGLEEKPAEEGATTKPVAKTKPAPTEPTFDPDNLSVESLTPANLAKYRATLAKQQIIDETDWTDDESVEAAEKALAEIEKSLPGKKGKPRSNASVEAVRKSHGSDDDGDDANMELSKEATDVAKSMAAYLNQRRGTVSADAE